jgi:hypothetical protein
MNADDVSTVQRTWAELRRRRTPLLEELTCRLAVLGPSNVGARLRAAWLYSAVDELVALLASPSRLAERACQFGESWPDASSAPCYAVEGRAWMSAAAALLPSWSDATDAAWRQAWLLLSDVLAAETLSPFADCWHRAPATEDSRSTG